MDVRYIKQFLAVARCQNMTNAAKELGVSQPSLSQAIKKLEESLGVPLFDRDGRNLVLNEYGKILLKQSEAATRSMDNAVKEINDAMGFGQHKIRMIVRCPMGNSAKLFEDYHLSHSDIVVSCLTLGENALESEYDLELFATSSDLSAKNILPVCEEDYVICVPKRHKYASRDSVQLKELSKESFILSAASSEMNTIEKEMFSEAGFKPNVSAYLSYYIDILRAVEQGMGICIATSITWFIGSDFDVVPIRIGDIKRSRSIYLRWPTHAYLSESSLGLVNYLCGKFRSFADEQRLQGSSLNHFHTGSL